MPQATLTKLLCLSWIALTVTACTTSTPASVVGLRQAIGNTLPGAQGKTAADQTNIDLTVARGCAAKVYGKYECDKHTKSSAERRAELKT